jgi:hypothetical protein
MNMWKNDIVHLYVEMNIWKIDIVHLYAKDFVVTGEVGIG